MTRETPIETYAAFAVRVQAMALPAEVMHHAKRCLVDWVAATLPGGVMAPATLMIDALSEDIGPAKTSASGRATLIPSGLSTTARTAALINGSASHTVEFDDIFRDGLYHPGSPVVAAALAVAEATGASGEALLRGIIAGYEVSNRIAREVNPRHYDFWHTTATVGFFGAATAAATIMGLDREKTAHAIAGVGTMAAGLQQAFLSDAMSKPLHAGRAAEGGVLSAQIAAKGVTGALDILEGPRGFGAAMSRDVDWAAATRDLGEDWTITRMTQKNHSACGHMHAAIDAVIALRNEHGLTADTVREIRVGSYQKSLEICGNQQPKTVFEAKFSMPYCLAAGLILGRVRFAAFEPDAMADPVLRDVMTRVVHTVDDACQSVFPRARSAKVEIDTTDGRTLFHHAPTRKGDPDAPLTDTELAEKYDELAVPVLGAVAARTLSDRLWSVETLARTGDLGLAGLSVAEAAE